MRRRAFARVLLLVAALVALSSGALAVTPKDWDRETPEMLQKDHLYAQTAVVIDARSGEVLFDKGAELRMYPASTTKIMTLLLAVESDIPLDRVVTIPEEAKNIASDSSIVPVFPGEQMTFQDLLYGFQINSGNDAGNAVAVLVGGSIEAFVAKMNERAAEIGCTDTYFSNPHGYHADAHYTTALDLARIARVAMRNQTFRQIVSAERYTMAPTANRGELQLKTGVSLMIPDSKYYYESCVGIKTGRHSKAGSCFVGAAAHDSTTLISVALNTSLSVDAQKWEDTIKLFEYGFSQYDEYLLDEFFDLAGRSINSITIENASKDDAQKGLLRLRLSQVSSDGYAMLVRRSDRALAEAVADFEVRAVLSLNEDVVKAPIEEGEILGTLVYTPDGGDPVTAMLTADRAVEARPEYVTMYDVLPFLRPLEPLIAGGWATYLLIALVAGFIVIIVLRTLRAVRRNRRRQRIYDIKRREYNRMQAERRREEMRRREAARKRSARTRGRPPRRGPGKRPQPRRAPRRDFDDFG